MTHGSLFSGIGGAELAASWIGWDNLFHCEINPFCRQVLEYHFPNSTSYEDITTTDFSGWRGKVDVLTGGFPCQPFSVAGQRKGAEDDRYLWPEVVRVIREVRPAWVVGENVAGILTMVQPGTEVEVGSEASLFGEADRKRVLLRQEYVIETICRDLEREGYSVQPVVIPACAVGAPHRRDRVWFVARRIAADTRRHGGQAEAKWKSGAAKENNEQPEPLSRMLAAAHRDNSGLQKERTEQQATGIAGKNTWYDASADCTDAGDESMQREGQDGIHAVGIVTDTNINRCGERTDKQEPVYRSERASDNSTCGKNGAVADTESQQSERYKSEQSEIGTKAQRKLGRSHSEIYSQYASYTPSKGFQRTVPPYTILPSECFSDFPTQSPVCSRDDGLSSRLDGITFSQWRQESIKAYGNAWVPQVAYEIFKAIEESGKTK